jgi:hypothetical protein
MSSQPESTLALNEAFGISSGLPDETLEVPVPVFGHQFDDEIDSSMSFSIDQ